jgi:hypothetical protein
MSQPQEAIHQESDCQPLIVYVPIPFSPSQCYDPQIQQKWQQSVFWQMNPLLGASSQFSHTSSFPFPTAIVSSETAPLTLPAQFTERLTAKEIEEDREFERKKRNSEGNFGKIILCIAYCYTLSVLAWFFSQGAFKQPSVATVAPINSQTVNKAIANAIATVPISQAAIAKISGDRTIVTPSVKLPNSLPVTTIPTQTIPVPPPPPSTIATNNIAPPSQTVRAKVITPPVVKTTETKKTETISKQFKPTKSPAIVKTPTIVKIPTAPNIQIVAPTPNNNEIVNIPAPPPPSQTSTSIAMVDTPSNIAQDGYKLMGILEVGEQSGALFQIDGVVQNVKINEIIGNSGWKLVAVVNGRVTISRNDRTRSLSVEEKL